MDEKNMSMGLLKIQVFAGNDAFPVEGAKVVISKDGHIEAFMITDSKGATPYIKLPSPVKGNSLEPYSGEKEENYRGDIYAEGFYPLKNLYISLVGGTSSLLSVNLIPSYSKGAKNV